MASQTIERETVMEPHLEPSEIASFVDRAAAPEARSRIEAHLATCAECRAEVADVARILASLPRARARHRRAWIAVGVAAALLVIVLPRARRDFVAGAHREAPVTSTVSPVAMTPAGQVDSVAAFVWSSVPHADRYHIRLFDSDGSVVWQVETTDTSVALPAAIELRPGRSYHWKVEGHIGFDRSTASELVEFVLGGRRMR